eukprot:scaffold16017_cov63-Phaeocystis_antarctica.AAC.10
MRDVRAAAAAALAQMPPSACVGLISFGWSVSVYLLDSTAAEAYAFPGVDAPSEDEKNQLAGLEPRALQPRGTCEAALLRALEALEPPEGAPPPTADAPRALGAALEICLEIASHAGAPRADLFVTLSGPPSFGPGALPPMPGAPRVESAAHSAAVDELRSLGRRLGAAGVCAHLHCTGSASFGAEALRRLVLPCSGSLRIERAPGSAAAAATLQADYATIARRGTAAGTGALVAVRASAGVEVSQIIGGAVALDGAVAINVEADRDAEEAGYACRLASLDERTCLTALLSPEAALGGKFAVVQVAVSYVFGGRQRRLRTLTHRVEISDGPHDQLSRMDTGATALLLARQLALRCGGAPLHAEADALAEALIEGHGEARHEVVKGWVFNGSRLLGYRAPLPLLGLLEALYILGRGGAAGARAPAEGAAKAADEHDAVSAGAADAAGAAGVAGAAGANDRHLANGASLEFGGGDISGAGHDDADELARQRLLLLTLPPTAAAPLALPRLSLVTTSSRLVTQQMAGLVVTSPDVNEAAPLTFRELPPHDLAVQPEASLLLDSGTHLFIRPATAAADGADGAAAPADLLTDAASRLALSRDPPARVLRADGAAGAAALLAQLQPTRREPPQRQARASFPGLAALPPPAQEQRISLLPHTTEVSFSEWAVARGVLLA